MDSIEVLSKCTGFDWDEHNAEKIRQRHQVSPSMCEEIFFNLPLVITADVKHSEQEIRYYALGRTASDRMLFVVFRIRNNLIRLISARDMSRKERKVYRSHE